MNPYIMGVDLGRMSDLTAIAILEEGSIRTARPDMHDLSIGHEGTVTTDRIYRLRHLDRPPVGTPYDKIIGQVKGLIDSPQLAAGCDLIVDATGVGRPVVDIMVAVGLSPVPITITGGSQVSPEQDEFGNIIGYHVPKHDLVGALQAWYGMHRLKMSRHLPLVGALEKELANFVPKITKAQNVSYEALREGDHDDLVLASALAMWWASFSRPWSTRWNILDEDKPKPYDPREYLTSV